MRAIAFDLDNTLTDRPPAFEQWALGFVEDMGIEDPDAIELLTALDDDGFGDKPAMFRAARERWNIEVAVEDLVAHFYEQMIDKNVLAPGAIDALRAVRAAGLATLIVTNGMPSQQAKIGKLGLADLAQGMAISSLVGVRKPEPAILAAAHQAGMRLDDIGWMIGDSAEADIRGAMAIGARTPAPQPSRRPNRLRGRHPQSPRRQRRASLPTRNRPRPARPLQLAVTRSPPAGATPSTPAR